MPRQNTARAATLITRLHSGHVSALLDRTRSAMARPLRAIAVRRNRDAHRTAAAVIAVLGTFGAVPLIHAEAPQECRYECGVDLEACKDGCIDSGGFDGCEEECGWVYEYCTDRCR